jgi:hypothetical protein
MVFYVLTRLSQIRVTVGYAAALLVVAAALLILGPDVEETVVSHLSTNVHNLAHGHLGTLVGSMFVTTTGYMYVWLPGLVCLLALAELFWRGGRLILAFGLGHMGATLVVAVGLAAAIRLSWLPVSTARTSDVGISYGAMAVLGALSIVIPACWRPAWIGWWASIALTAAVVSGDFTNTGHCVALAIGMTLASRFRVDARWTPPRRLLLAVGAAFGYLILGYELPVVLALIVGTTSAAGVAAIAVLLRRHVLPLPRRFTSPRGPAPAGAAALTVDVQRLNSSHPAG